MTSGITLLIVDDDESLRRELAAQLTLHEGFRVLEAGSVADARELARTAPLAAILLDVGLPDGDGRELCRGLRREGFRAPIIMLTAHGTEDDTVPCFRR